MTFGQDSLLQVLKSFLPGLESVNQIWLDVKSSVSTYLLSSLTILFLSIRSLWPWIFLHISQSDGSQSSGMTLFHAYFSFQVRSLENLLLVFLLVKHVIVEIKWRWIKRSCKCYSIIPIICVELYVSLNHCSQRVRCYGVCGFDKEKGESIMYLIQITRAKLGCLDERRGVKISCVHVWNERPLEVPSVWEILDIFVSQVSRLVWSWNILSVHRDLINYG